MTAHTTQILEASVIQANGIHAIVAVSPPGGGDPVPMRVAAQGAWAPGDATHVKAKLKTTTILEDMAIPGTFGPLTAAPPKVADVLVMIDEITAPKQTTVFATGRAGGGKPTAFPALDPATLPTGIIAPAYPDNYAMPNDLQQYGDLLARISDSGSYVRGLVTGPTGTGKSTFVQAFAAQHGRPYCRVNMSAFVSPDEVFGQRTIVTGPDGTVTGYDETPLIRAFQTPRCVIQIDEINRVHASVSNGMLDLLDDMMFAYVPGLNRTIRVEPSVILLATMNYGVAYSGTFQLDAAMRSRLSYPIEIDYLDEKTEIAVLARKSGISHEAAESLVQFAADVRQRANPDESNPLDFGISTRQLLAAAAMIGAGGASASEAVRRTILPLYSTEGGRESQRTIVGGIVQGKFGA